MPDAFLAPLTLGTAGHIDHGKTALIRALTGVDTDRLPEERARGISIDLGYAPLELPDGTLMLGRDVPAPPHAQLYPEVLDRIDDPRLRIADVRWYLLDEAPSRRAYEAGHLPHAIFVDVPTVLAAPMGDGPGRHPLPAPARFALKLGQLGIGDEHLVVADDDAGGSVAARLWWMLEDLGHRVVTVLDGGIEAWRAAGDEPGALDTLFASLDPGALPRRQVLQGSLPGRSGLPSFSICMCVSLACFLTSLTTAPSFRPCCLAISPQPRGGLCVRSLVSSSMLACVIPPGIFLAMLRSIDISP